MQHPKPLRDLTLNELPENPDTATLDQLLLPTEDGQDIGLMSDAGCPAIADPGAKLVRRAHERNIPVHPMIGPSSLLLALMASGLDGQRFAFHGYLPARDPERSHRIAELERESARAKQTQVFIETPYRNKALFESLLKTCQPHALLSVATDLSLPTQEIKTLRIAEWRKRAIPAFDKRPTVFSMLAG